MMSSAAAMVRSGCRTSSGGLASGRIRSCSCAAEKGATDGMRRILELEKEVGCQIFFINIRLLVCRQIGNAGAAQHFIVEKEAAADLAAWLRENPVRGVGHDRGTAGLPPRLLAGNQPNRFGIDRG